MCTLLTARCILQHSMRLRVCLMLCEVAASRAAADTLHTMRCCWYTQCIQCAAAGTNNVLCVHLYAPDTPSTLPTVPSFTTVLPPVLL